MSLSRSFTLTERLYRAAEDLAPPFVLQYVVQGRGRCDPADVARAWQATAEALPALRLRGAAPRWQLGAQPALHQAPTSLFDDWNAPLFHRPMAAGQVAELFHGYGADSQFLLRIRHRVMDAKGVQLVLRHVFARLRGEVPRGVADFPADHVVRQQLPASSAKRAGYALRWPSLPLASTPAQHRLVVHSLPGRVEAPLARTAAWLATRWQQPCRFLVPVDLRRHAGVPAATANLSLPLYLPVQPGQRWQAVQAQLLAELNARRELAREPLEWWGRRVPPAWLRSLLAQTLRRAQAHGRYPMSGFLSHNGALRLADLSAPGFAATQVVALPVFVPLAPFCLVVLEQDQATHLALALPTHPQTEALLADWHHLWPQPAAAAATDSVAEAPPHPLYAALLQRWAEVLDLPAAQVPPDATFHALGGDSIQLLTVLSETADQHLPHAGTAFIEAALQTGGQLSLRDTLALLDRHGS